VWVCLPVNPYVPPVVLVGALVCLGLAPRFSWRMTGGDVLVHTAFALVGVAALGGELSHSSSPAGFRLVAELPDPEPTDA